MRNTAFTALFALLLAWAPLCAAGALSESLVLVARPELQGLVYGRTVLVVAPFGIDQHLGFIINRPTRFTLGKIFPQHAPSQKVLDPVFFGGPMDPRAIFALVARDDSPGGGCIEMMPGLFAAFDGRTVDRMIEANPDDARFVAGLVVWRPGELRYEIEQGAWYVLRSDAKLAMREPEGLWEELVRRAQRARHLHATGG
jgi:putative transcriptional regulator